MIARIAFWLACALPCLAQLEISGSPPLPVAYGGTGTTTSTGIGSVVLSGSPFLADPFISNLYGGNIAGSSVSIQGTSYGTPSGAFVNIQPNGQFTEIGNSCAPPSLFTISTNASCNPTANSTIAANSIQIIGRDSGDPGLSIDAYGASAYPYLLMREATGTGASPSATTSGAYQFQLLGYGWDSTNLFYPNFVMAAQANQNFTSTAHGTTFAISVSPTGGIGQDTIFSATAATLSLPEVPALTTAVYGSLCWNTGGAVTYDHTTTCLLSSRRFKHAIHPLMGDGSLALIDKLHPVRFKYNSTNEQRDGGLIAEEVAKVDPHLVNFDKDGKPIGVMYIDLIPILISALQEQQKEIEQLKARIR